MAGESRNLTVSLSPAALLALEEIWDWNSGYYNPEHASKYIAFLLAETNKLSVTHAIGKTVPGLPNFSYIVIRKRRKGHGHLVVYELIGGVVEVLNFYHTSQDWPRALAESLGE